MKNHKKARVKSKVKPNQEKAENQNPNGSDPGPGSEIPGNTGFVEFAKGGWIQKAVNPKHKGYCTPMTKATCTPKRKAFAMTMKKHHGFHKEGGVTIPIYADGAMTPNPYSGIPYGMIGNLGAGIVDASTPVNEQNYSNVVGKDTASDALRFAGMGASIGSGFGPIGTAIGAGVGAIGGAIEGNIRGKNEKKEYQNDASKNYFAQQQKTFDQKPNYFAYGGSPFLQFANGGNPYLSKSNGPINVGPYSGQFGVNPSTTTVENNSGDREQRGNEDSQTNPNTIEVEGAGENPKNGGELEVSKGKILKDFKGKDRHSSGGYQYDAKSGRVIIPLKDREKYLNSDNFTRNTMERRLVLDQKKRDQQELEQYRKGGGIYKEGGGTGSIIPFNSWQTIFHELPQSQLFANGGTPTNGLTPMNYPDQTFIPQQNYNYDQPIGGQKANIINSGPLNPMYAQDPNLVMNPNSFYDQDISKGNFKAHTFNNGGYIHGQPHNKTIEKDKEIGQYSKGGTPQNEMVKMSKARGKSRVLNSPPTYCMGGMKKYPMGGNTNPNEDSYIDPNTGYPAIYQNQVQTQDQVNQPTKSGTNFQFPNAGYNINIPGNKYVNNYKDPTNQPDYSQIANTVSTYLPVAYNAFMASGKANKEPGIYNPYTNEALNTLRNRSINMDPIRRDIYSQERVAATPLGENQGGYLSRRTQLSANAQNALTNANLKGQEINNEYKGQYASALDNFGQQQRNADYESRQQTLRNKYNQASYLPKAVTQAGQIGRENLNIPMYTDVIKNKYAMSLLNQGYSQAQAKVETDKAYGVQDSNRYQWLQQP